jgi:hypothetical protein
MAFINILLILILALCSFSSLSKEALIHSKSAWKLESNEGGINIYTLKMEANGVIPLKTEVLVSQRVEQVIAVLDDNNRRHEWAKRFKGSHLIKRISPYEKIIYTRADFPLWFEDRTAIIHVKIEVSKDLKTITIFGSSIRGVNTKQFPPYTRAEVYDSSILLESLNQGTRITIISYSDPKGSIPNWVVNLLKEKIAVQTLVRLREQIKKNLYTPAQLNVYTERIKNYYQKQN